jgi:hypothetical protein
MTLSARSQDRLKTFFAICGKREGRMTRENEGVRVVYRTISYCGEPTSNTVRFLWG